MWVSVATCSRGKMRKLGPPLDGCSQMPSITHFQQTVHQTFQDRAAAELGEVPIDRALIRQV
jgi:hypothetical protein